MCHRSMIFIISLMIAAFIAMPAGAQLSDLDLLEDDDRSIGISLTRAPDTVAETDTESRAAILLLPLSLGTFQGGAGAYYTGTLANGESSSALLWRVQGGPQFGKVGIQGYVEGEWKGKIDYAAFMRVGTFDVGQHCQMSGGIGTLVRADTQTTLETGIQRTGASATDTKVKGLLLLSADIDTEIFDTLRLLGTLLPSTNEGETDMFLEPQVSYKLGDINLTGYAKFGRVDGGWTKRYTGLLQVPF